MDGSKRPPAEQVAFSKSKESERHSLYIQYNKEVIDHLQRKWFSFDNKRINIKQGLKVRIVLKQDQKSGKLTEGVVKDILTNSPTHNHGIKVRLTSGEVGRVKEIVEGT